MNNQVPLITVCSGIAVLCIAIAILLLQEPAPEPASPIRGSMTLTLTRLDGKKITLTSKTATSKSSTAQVPTISFGSVLKKQDDGSYKMVASKMTRENTAPKRTYTKEQTLQLKADQSLDEVVEILGGRGNKITLAEADKEMFMMEWPTQYDEDILLTFRNNKLKSWQLPRPLMKHKPIDWSKYSKK